jgi:cytidine deaminase
MHNEVFNFDFKVYDSIEELNDEDIELLTEARKVTQFAYVPYSRTLMSVASTLFPNVAIKTMAISYDNLKGKSDHPISPCGICRQSLVEFQQRTGHPIRIILGGMEGKVQVIENAANLLPFSFSADDMKSKQKEK